MWRPVRYRFLVVPFLLFTACEEDCPQGDEGCACYGNQSCNGALACRSETCVALTAAGENGDGSGVDLDACFECSEGSCPDEVSTCRDTEGCEGFVDCVIECGSDQSCQTDCTESRSTEAQTNAVLLTACAFVACPQECVGAPPSPDVDTPTGGPNPPPPVLPGGPDDPANPPSNPGDPADPGEPVPDEPETTLVSGVNWLTLDGAGAPSSAAPNGLLGVEGVFYAYGDPCATYTWDETSRCITGSHCAPSADNWGVGIGFDFYNDGTTKTTWSATEHLARGVEWSVSGDSSAAFQVWITNMDPSHGTSCGATLDCAIAGPPDGYSSASFTGTMYFDNLSKDDWGGTGVAYTFDPTRILSVQFKIPSSSVNPDFGLCIGRFGVIL